MCMYIVHTTIPACLMFEGILNGYPFAEIRKRCLMYKNILAPQGPVLLL